jgi:hypothetical protein
MDATQQAAIHQALVKVQHALTGMSFPGCDQGDLLEAIEAVEEQLQARHPNATLVSHFLNSIARSLRAQPQARDTCLVIEESLGKAGLPSTWQSGV